MAEKTSSYSEVLRPKNSTARILSIVSPGRKVETRDACVMTQRKTSRFTEMRPSVPYIGREVRGRYSLRVFLDTGINSTMHLEAKLSFALMPVPARGRAEGTEASEPFAMASLVVGLWRKMRAWSFETMAMARWG